MQFTVFLIVSVAVIGRMSASKIIVDLNKPDGFAELEESAIQILSTCYTDQDKATVLLGDFPGNFVERLSSRKTLSLVLMDDGRRAKNNNDNVYKLDVNRMHKAQVVVIMATYRYRLVDLFRTLQLSVYSKSMASILVISWSPEHKYSGCNNIFDIANMFGEASSYNQINAKIMCRNSTTDTASIYAFNSFTNVAPEPWRSVGYLQSSEGNIYNFFLRQSSEHEMCKNLDFDKTYDLGGTTIETINWGHGTDCPRISNTLPKKKQYTWLQWTKYYSFIPSFMTYINATMRCVWSDTLSKDIFFYVPRRLSSRPHRMRLVNKHWSYTPPHDTSCIFLITQFRGNKSQLSKILSVVDNYTWIGLFAVYLVTLVYFKYFLRQTLLSGILNLVRLTSNSGLTTVPPNVAARIYLACLLFVVVTMQGIFSGEWATLLTHDFPVRQVNTIQDVADLGYNVYVSKADFIYFDDPVFEGRLIEKAHNINCITYVKRDPSIACLGFGDNDMESAIMDDLWASQVCVATEYISNLIPWQWALEERMNKFLGIVIGAGIKIPLDAIAYKKRIAEFDSLVLTVGNVWIPNAMTLKTLCFAFVILGIGLGCATIVFLIEITINRFNRRVTRTRVIVMN